MAKKSTAADRSRQPQTNTRMMNFAEDLGRILGTTQAKATAWLNQRQEIAKQLAQVRDAAERLIADLTGDAAKVTARVRRAPRTTSQPRARRKMSPEARKRISEAAKKRWAEIKAKRGKTKTTS